MHQQPLSANQNRNLDGNIKSSQAAKSGLNCGKSINSMFCLFQWFVLQNTESLHCLDDPTALANFHYFTKDIRQTLYHSNLTVQFLLELSYFRFDHLIICYECSFTNSCSICWAILFNKTTFSKTSRGCKCTCILISIMLGYLSLIECHTTI